MINKSIWQQLKPHVLAIAIFFLIAVIYCLPALKGYQPSQHDILGWKAMSQQSMEFKEKYGHFPLWTNSMLSGMPAYQIAIDYKYDITLAWAHNIMSLFLPAPASQFFLSCVCFYILCMALGLRRWVGILGALSYAFASYNAVIFIAGHMSKFSTLAYAPAFLAGLVLLSQRKYVVGFLTTLLFATLMTWQNHVQIVYYVFLTSAFLGIAYAVHCIRQKTIKPLLLTAGLAVAATAIGVASFAVILLPTSTFTKESMRGGRSELTVTNSTVKSKGGLDKDYAFNWSYGISETFTLMVPRIYGGGDPKVIENRYESEIGQGSKTAEVLSEQTGMPEEQANEYVQQPPFYTYWGPQPGTSGTVYAGAVICFLCIVGLVLYRGWHLGWIVAATVFGILLSWGNNFASFNYFLFDHMPYYNKFRAPSMALVIPQITLPLLAALGLNQVITLKEGGQLKELLKKYKIILIITAATFVVLAGLYIMMDYTSERDNAVRENFTNGMLQQLSRGQQPTPEMEQRANTFGRSVVAALKDDRKDLFGKDLFRSLVFVGIAAGLLFAFFRDKLSSRLLMPALAILSFIDLITVDLRYLSHKNYEVDAAEAAFTPNRADLQIQQDTGYFRVLDQTVGNPFLDSRAAYFHNSVGGQHPARLGLYDDLINRQLTKGNMSVYNMLNTKYFIVSNPADQQPIAQQNPGALGAAWLVKTIKYADNADQEMNALDTFDPKDTAIAQTSEKSKIPFTPQFDSAASIRLVQNLNDKIIYEFNAASNQFAVFSEIYYPIGWKAFIDGKETPIVKVNYVLRGLAVPPGKHTIEFRFEPASYTLGNNISLVIGIFSILAVLGGIWWKWKNYRSQNAQKI